MTKTASLAAAAAAALVFAASADARDRIRVVGSSTLFPFSTAVAENFGASTEFPTPFVESTGTGAGFQLFCSGVGVDHPDVSNASRRITEGELNLCISNGVTDIGEVQVGYDGIVFAQAEDAPEINLTLRTVFAALAAEIPTSDDDCTLIENPNVRWSDIDPSLPATRIEVFGPPPTSGTRDAFVELAMEAGAREYACLNELRSQDRDAFEGVAHFLREDGAWIDSGENDNAIVATLTRTPSAIGVFGFSFLDQNGDRLRGAMVDDVEPTFENIADGAYPISRSLYFYVKRQHVGVVPGVQEFAEAFTSDPAWGPEGYLSDRGLIPLDDELRAATAAAVREGALLSAADLADHSEETPHGEAVVEPMSVDAEDAALEDAAGEALEAVEDGAEVVEELAEDAVEAAEDVLEEGADVADGAVEALEDAAEEAAPEE